MTYKCSSADPGLAALLSMLHVESPVSGASGYSWRLSEESRKHEVCTPHCFNLHDSNYSELAVNNNITVKVPTTGLLVFF